MNPTPETKFDEIIDQLNKMDAGDPRNRLALMRHKKDAEAIIKDYPWSGFDILGVIACLEKNIPEMHRFHKQAIASSGNTPSKLFNYGTSLDRLGFLEQSYHYTKEAFERDPRIDIRYALIRRAVNCGRFLKALELTSDIPPEDIEKEDLNSVFHFLVKAVKIVLDGGFSDDDISRMFQIIQKTLHDSNVYENVSIFNVFDFGEGDLISCELFLSFDGADVIDLDFKLDENISKSDIKEGVLGIMEICLVDEALDQVISHIESEIGKGNHVEPLSGAKMAIIEDLVSGVVL